jgi:ribonuclease HII
MPDFALEMRCRGVVCGVDEAGRGPLAGPVVAAAVVLDRRRLPRTLRDGLDDSKKLSPEAREEYAALLRRIGVPIGVGAASVEEIDRRNILRATLLAMGRAVAALKFLPAIALVDGNVPPPLPCAVKTVIGGDGLSLSIAAASVIAKVTRDRLMRRLAQRYAGYGWQTNVGYATPEHRNAIAALGPTRHHRRSFAPLQLAFPFDAEEAVNESPLAAAYGGTEEPASSEFNGSGPVGS